MKTTLQNHLPVKLSRDDKTGEPHTYNNGHELKIAPENRSSANYISVGGPHKEQFAALIVRAVNNHEALLQALKDLTKEISLKSLNIRKDFSLLNAHASATKAISQAQPFTH